MKLRAKKGNYFFQKIRTIRKQYFKNQLFHSDVIAKPYKNPNRNPSYLHPKQS